MMLRGKMWVLWLLAPMLLWIAVACGGEEEVVEVQLALDWYPNANHAGLYVAFEKGYFEDENLVVDMYTPSDPSTVNATVAAGSDEFGINYQPDVLIARSQGVPVVSVAGIVQHPLNSVQSLVSSNITRAQRPGGQAGRLSGNSHQRTPAGHHAQVLTELRQAWTPWSWSTLASTLPSP